MGVLYDQCAGTVRKVFGHRIDGPALLDPARHFPDAWRFSRARRDIRREALELAAHLEQVPRLHDIMKEQGSISAGDDKDWRIFVLKAYGVENRRNMAQCPVLASLVAGSFDVISAALSILAPGKHVPAHRGPFRGALRFYLALAMPRAPDGRRGAVLKIGGTEYRLADGASLLWDDTYLHEIWNDTDDVRAVLLLDVRRHGMPLDMEILSRVLVAVIRAGIRIRGLQ